MSYKGSDLSQEFKTWFRAEKKRITKVLEAKGCTNIQFDYGFYYFSGFWTSASGQIYYMSCSDVRHFPNEKYLYRTAKHYKDWTGGCNQYVNPNELENIKLI
jgi:hypothetical protein